MKYLFTARNIFGDILDVNPQPTGCYLWYKVFKGDIMPMSMVEDYTAYDVVHINLTQYDHPYLDDIKRAIKGSSTKLVINQDHVPQIWDKCFVHPLLMRQAYETADHVFATTVEAQSMLEAIMPTKNIHFIEHPCETHVLKHLKFERKQKHMAVMYHQYDNPVFHPFFATYNQGLPVAVINYHQASDPRSNGTRSMYDQLYEPMPFQTWLRLIGESQLVYEPYTCNSFGRLSCETACLKTPTVGSDKVGSMRRLWPMSNGDVFDAKKMRELIRRMLDDEQFRMDCVEYAYDKVEHYNFRNSKKKFEEMLQS